MGDMRQRAAPRWRGRALLICGGVAIGVCALVLVEGLFRALDLGSTALRRDPFAGFSSTVPMFDGATGPDGSLVYRISNARSEAATGQPLDQPQREFRGRKKPGVYRIFVVGGSSAAGVPYGPRYAFSSWLGRRLHAHLPDVEFEIVNAAMAGYATSRIAIVVDEIAAHEPDLLIVYSGHNEMAERRFYAHLLDTHPLLFRIRERIFATRLGRTVLAALDQVGEAAPSVPQLDSEADEREMYAVLTERAGGRGYPTEREVAYGDLRYRFNLEKMVRRMQSVGANVVLMTLSQKFAGWAPGASAHRPDLTAAELVAFDRFAGDGVRRVEEGGDCAAALASFAEALAIDSTHAGLHYRIAQCQEALGHHGAARVSYRTASDLDQVPHGAPTRFNDILRDVAAGEGAWLVEAAAALDEASPRGIPGDEFFVDWVHPNIAAHQLMAAAVEETLRRNDWPVGAVSWRSHGYVEPRPADLYRSDPGLRLGEGIVRMGTCVLARRAECALAEIDAILGADPYNRRLRHYRKWIATEAADWRTPAL
jgi:lysophospholipase L1-like esterase